MSKTGNDLTASVESKMIAIWPEGSEEWIDVVIVVIIIIIIILKIVFWVRFPTGASLKLICQHQIYLKSKYNINMNNIWISSISYVIKIGNKYFESDMLNTFLYWTYTWYGMLPSFPDDFPRMDW